MRPRTRNMWGGFVDDRLCLVWITDTYGAHYAPAIFYNRADARKQFADVRRIEVREVKEKK